MKNVLRNFALFCHVMAQLSFEVASIKLNASLDRSSFTRRGEDSLVLQNWPLRHIILKAYGLKNYAGFSGDMHSARRPFWIKLRRSKIIATGVVALRNIGQS